MREKIQKFFSDTWNIVLTVFQCIGIIAFILIELSSIFAILFLLCEGVFFMLFGIKMLKRKKKILEDQAVYDQLPYSQEQIELIHKANERTIKNNKLMGIMMMALGFVLIFLILYVIF